MIFRQLFDSKSSTFTYLLADSVTKKAVLIDPVFEQTGRDIALLKELGLELLYALDTHCHADHVTASWLLKQKLGCAIGCAKIIGAVNADLQLVHGDIIEIGSLALDVRATPGHTDGCLTYVEHNARMAFTGDALLIRGCGRCDFQQGDPAQLFDSVYGQIFCLDEDYMLYPAHDYAGRCATSVGEEKQFNVRLGGQANKQDFVGYMSNMTLPHPKYIDIALPANMKCGEPEFLPEEPEWAPVELTYGGIYEVAPYWVARHLSELTVLDVREPDETVEAHVEGARFIPLGELAASGTSLPKDKPIVTFCRSGRRSALAVSILTSLGFDRVANVQGGIIHWREQGLPLRR